MAVGAADIAFRNLIGKSLQPYAILNELAYLFDFSATHVIELHDDRIA